MRTAPGIVATIALGGLALGAAPGCDGCGAGAGDASGPPADAGPEPCVAQDVLDLVEAWCAPRVLPGEPDAPACACLAAGAAACAAPEDCLLAIRIDGSVLAGNDGLLASCCPEAAACIVVPGAPVRCEAGTCRFDAQAFACTGSGVGPASGCTLSYTGCDCLAVVPGTTLSTEMDPVCEDNACPVASGEEVQCVDGFCELAPTPGRPALREVLCTALTGA